RILGGGGNGGGLQRAVGTVGVTDDQRLVLRDQGPGGGAGDDGATGAFHRAGTRPSDDRHGVAVTAEPTPSGGSDGQGGAGARGGIAHRDARNRLRRLGDVHHPHRRPVHRGEVDRLVEQDRGGGVHREPVEQVQVVAVELVLGVGPPRGRRMQVRVRLVGGRVDEGQVIGEGNDTIGRIELRDGVLG